MQQFFQKLGGLGLGLAFGSSIVSSALYNVDGGHRAVMFDRFRGVLSEVSGEGTHFLIPWVQKPIVFDIRARPKNVPSITGSKDLQNVNITLRILFRPMPDSLPNIYTTLGEDYENRVLPSITNEVLKAVVAQFDAGELITQREVVSSRYVLNTIHRLGPNFFLNDQSKKGHTVVISHTPHSFLKFYRTLHYFRTSKNVKKMAKSILFSEMTLVVPFLLKIRKNFLLTIVPVYYRVGIK